ncbi:Lecithin:cholesterol acyltransferase [Paenibacillus sp. yr247]|uniref:OmpL47-type beta-barrel domain-containing protein n=1 Tax=Paenibacillus sp. yr247 TaxID=1761880 RepID=UPI0008831606|nr:Ig-like domain-containing protein [Paenibacillus sp. yr247]SDO53878.1 Lecithin:cholesterol acyltransferase [Paenibacillus sp. yr247]
MVLGKRGKKIFGVLAIFLLVFAMFTAIDIKPAKADTGTGWCPNSAENGCWEPSCPYGSYTTTNYSSWEDDRDVPGFSYEWDYTCPAPPAPDPTPTPAPDPTPTPDPGSPTPTPTPDPTPTPMPSNGGGGGGGGSGGPVSDIISPTASISVPDSNQPFIQNKSITIYTSATDNVGVTVLQLLADGNIVDTRYDTSSATFSYTPATAGGHSLTVVAYDATGNQGSDSYSFTAGTADNVPPTVSLTKDPNNKYVAKNKIRLNFTASDNVAVASMKLQVVKDGTVLYDGLDVMSQTFFDLFVYDAGQYHVTLIVTDPSGNTGSDYVDFYVDIVRNVVLFVPGFLGTEINMYNQSELSSTKIWPVVNISNSQLGLPANGQPGDTYPGDVFEKVDVLGITLNDVTEQFLTSLRDAGIQVVKVPYDWRIDLNDSRTQKTIDDKINEALSLSNGQDITIITHSLGALPVRKYLIDHPNAKVKNFIPIAGPFLGTPRSMQGLEVGDDLDLRQFKFLPLPLTIPQGKRLVQNMTSVYELLPDEAFVNAYKQVYEGTNFTYESFFTDYSEHTRYVYGSFVTNYSQTSQYISDNHNSALYQTAKAFRSYIENNNIDSHIKEYRIAAYGQETAIKIEKADQYIDPNNPGLGTEEKYHLYWGKGDSVVPVRSADFNRAFTNGNTQIFYYKDLHLLILTNPDVQQLIKNIVINADSSNGSTTYLSDSYLNGESVEINCPVNVQVTDDQGHKAGLNSDGILENDIPGLAYEILGSTKALYVPAGLNVQFNLFGYDNGYMDISFTKYSQDLPTKTNSLQHTKIGKSTALTFTVNGNITDASNLNVNYDYLGNGKIQVLHPSTILTVAEHSDLIAPVTKATSAGSQSNGWYASDVTVTLSATDSGGSGVTRTYYQVDSGDIQDYMQPFAITTEGVHLLKFYSTDKAGNYEGAQEQKIQIDKSKPIITAQVVPSPNTAGWNNSDVQLKFTAVDNLSGIANVTLDEVVSTEGANQTFTGGAMDVAGNSSSTSITLNIDKTAPKTTLALQGQQGNNDWYTSDVTVTLSAIDNLSGVSYTEYSFDNGVTWTKYSSPIIVTAEQINTISYRSVDIAGNVEQIQQNTIKIDKTPPVIDFPKLNVEYYWGDSLTVTFSVYDKVSGIQQVTSSVYGNPIQGGVQFVITHPGINTVTIQAKDNAGLTTVVSQTFNAIIPATINFDPNTLSKNSNGNTGNSVVTVYITLPTAFDVSQIDSSSIILNQSLHSAEAHPVTVDTVSNQLMVKFNRDQVESILQNGEKVQITIDGIYGIGVHFRGFDFIRVR